MSNKKDFLGFYLRACIVENFKKIMISHINPFKSLLDSNVSEIHGFVGRVEEIIYG